MLGAEVRHNRAWIQQYITRWCNLAIQLSTDMYRSDCHQLGIPDKGSTRGRILTVSMSIHQYVTRC